MSADVYTDTGAFAIVPEWVLDADISAQAVRLYAVLRRYADNRTGYAHPSRATLAVRVRCKDAKAVDKPLEELRAIGALVILPRWRSHDDDTVSLTRDEHHRSRTSNGYRVLSVCAGGVGVKNGPPPPAETEGVGVASGQGVGVKNGQGVGVKSGEELEPVELEPVELHLAPAAQAPPTPAKTTKQQRRTQVPEDFTVTDAMKAWARQHTPDAGASETQQFLDHHRGKGSTMADWPAAWRTWMRNAQRWTYGANQRSPQPTRNAAGLDTASREQVAQLERWYQS